MKINAELIAKFKPCESRFENFKIQYPGFNGSPVEFISLDNISYNDKVWVCVRLMSRNQKFYWARSCARSVLELFEQKYPNVPAVSNLLNYLDPIKDVTKLTSAGKNQIAELRRATAAYAAAADADADAAYAAYAATAAAYAADAAAYAAVYAAYAAAAAADAAAAAAAARLEQQEYNLIILKEIMDLDI